MASHLGTRGQYVESSTPSSLSKSLLSRTDLFCLHSKHRLRCASASDSAHEHANDLWEHYEQTLNQVSMTQIKRMPDLLMTTMSGCKRTAVGSRTTNALSNYTLTTKVPMRRGNAGLIMPETGITTPGARPPNNSLQPHQVRSRSSLFHDSSESLSRGCRAGIPGSRRA